LVDGGSAVVWWQRAQSLLFHPSRIGGCVFVCFRGWWQRAITRFDNEGDEC